MRNQDKSVSLQIYPIDFDYISMLAEAEGVTKRNIIRHSMRVGLRTLLEKHEDGSLLEQYDAAIRNGFEEECQRKAESLHRRWALDFGASNNAE